MSDAPTILFAEDDLDYSAEILNLLEPLKVNVITVENGRQAAFFLCDLSQEIDLVITDMTMPGGSGWMAIKVARIQRGDSLPIILQTGAAEFPDVRRRAKRFGINLMDKADLREQLVPAVREALRLSPTRLS